MTFRTFSTLLFLLTSTSCIFNPQDYDARDHIYIDDFEDSKLSDPIDIKADRWFRASPPVLPDSLWHYPPAWDFYWFCPISSDLYHRIKRGQIIELSEAEKKATMTDNLYLNVLRLHASMAPRLDPLVVRFTKAWAGIMYPITPNAADKTPMRYFEFFVKADQGFQSGGTLKLQMGTMREDISLNGGPPNGSADGENTALPARSYSSTLDVGWDQLPDDKEVYLYPSLTQGEWDTLRSGNSLFGIDSLDPARDNWRRYSNNGNFKNYRYACREGGNGSISNSEDINRDGTVQTAITERYFQCTIDLADRTSKFIDTTIWYANPGEWRKYSIPLQEIVPGDGDGWDSINNPDWSAINMLRIIWSDIDEYSLAEENQLVFWNMEFVGNQWLAANNGTRTLIRPSAINTKENADYEYYWSKYHTLIDRERDEYGFISEQSLRLNYVNLEIGDTALVEKFLRNGPVDISNCDSLSLLVFGLHSEPDNPPMEVPLYSGDLRFIFRFGTNNGACFEYSRLIYPEWNNRVIISQKALSDLMDAALAEPGDSFTNIQHGNNGSIGETLGIHAFGGRLPEVSNIEWMALGVAHVGNVDGAHALSGEIWVNEMKRIGIK